MTRDLPPRCTGLCPLNSGPDISDYPISLTRNCEGPAPSRKGDGSIAYITRSGETNIVAVLEQMEFGGLVCRNAGLLKSLEALRTVQDRAASLESTYDV